VRIAENLQDRHFRYRPIKTSLPRKKLSFLVLPHEKEHAMTTAIELVLFRLKPHVSEADFLSVLSATTEWLAHQPGFIMRRHGRGDSGERIDYLEWESMEYAKAAAEKFPAAPEIRAFLDAIDPASILTRHFEVIQ
jgi:hypothetical protein